MTPNQEMIMTLFNKEIISKVKKQFKSGAEIVPIDSYQISYRLFKTKADTINLETLVRQSLDNRIVTFFKPIGFYTCKKGFLKMNVSISLLKEFEKDFCFLRDNKKISSNLKVEKLSLEDNAVIAAFSIEAAVCAEKYIDDSFIANGLYCDIFIANQGYPQVFLDDKHGLKGPISAYLLREQNTVNPIYTYTEHFKRLKSMDLLTAFKSF